MLYFSFGFSNLLYNTTSWVEMQAQVRKDDEKGLFLSQTNILLFLIGDRLLSLTRDRPKKHQALWPVLAHGFQDALHPVFVAMLSKRSLPSPTGYLYPLVGVAQIMFD